jgi:hypothetical protein
MSAVRATWKNGQIVLDGPVAWPEGLRLVIEPDESRAGAHDDTPMTAEEIVRTLAAMDKVEPFDMTEEERAALEAERRARKEWEKAHFAERAEKLRGLWE